MDVFLCGGSGMLGRRVLELLRGPGHRVRALSRTEATDAIMRERGAEPVRGDLFDAGSLERMVAGSDAILHLRRASRRPVVLAMEKAPAGIHDAVDDNPLTKRETARALATALGRRWLVRLPWTVARVVGGDSAATAGRSQRVSNRRLREATGWMPAVPDACVGYRLLVGRPAR